MQKVFFYVFFIYDNKFLFMIFLPKKYSSSKVYKKKTKKEGKQLDRDDCLSPVIATFTVESLLVFFTHRVLINH